MNLVQPNVLVPLQIPCKLKSYLSRGSGMEATANHHCHARLQFMAYYI